MWKFDDAPFHMKKTIQIQITKENLSKYQQKQMQVWFTKLSIIVIVIYLILFVQCNSTIQPQLSVLGLFLSRYVMTYVCACSQRVELLLINGYVLRCPAHFSKTQTRKGNASCRTRGSGKKSFRALDNCLMNFSKSNQKNTRHALWLQWANPQSHNFQTVQQSRVTFFQSFRDSIIAHGKHGLSSPSHRCPRKKHDKKAKL